MIMTRYLSTLALVTIVAATGCSAPADVEKVPVGTEVEIVRQDGGVSTARSPAATNVR